MLDRWLHRSRNTTVAFHHVAEQIILFVATVRRERGLWESRCELADLIVSMYNELFIVVLRNRLLVDSINEVGGMWRNTMVEPPCFGIISVKLTDDLMQDVSEEVEERSQSHNNQNSNNHHSHVNQVLS